ncbi:MAG: hypothetical protein Q9211_000975 [Gyalolechia sp. 1 TL-2023]
MLVTKPAIPVIKNLLLGALCCDGVKYLLSQSCGGISIDRVPYLQARNVWGE